MGSRCLWNVPSQNAKRACPSPLKDITFKKHVVHKKKEVKVKRQLLSVSAPSGGCLDDVKHYVDAIKSKEPGLLWCRYIGQPEPPRFQCPILDDEGLHSKKCRQLLRAQMEAIRPLELAEASAICSATVGQGRNPSWKRERVGRITVSNFRRVVHCQQPESLVRDILYPQNVILKPGDPRPYGIENEGKAVQQYLELMTYYDKEVRVEETGLHVYHEYPCIGASPDRIVYDGENVGVLEVKCPLSKKGQTPKAAALDKKFYAYILEANSGTALGHGASKCTTVGLQLIWLPVTTARAQRTMPPKMADPCLLLPRMRSGNPGKGTFSNPSKRAQSRLTSATDKIIYELQKKLANPRTSSGLMRPQGLSVDLLAPADLRARGVIASGVIAGRTSSRRYPSSQEFGARALGRRTSTGSADADCQSQGNHERGVIAGRTSSRRVSTRCPEFNPGLPDHTAVHSEGRLDSPWRDLPGPPET
ncbi:hypothetical protein HPB47_006351 [Ixodes persulcatus]|uniref:Uncharacterized protein n=1 Tax=Ixodes persulcatus TaxID=34615 RepID=A0AC60PBF7_IXOPE|nr:hypothetical protein HPB47_006351 [Ixodes persulcatus]